jgi:hypothetical protein
VDRLILSVIPQRSTEAKPGLRAFSQRIGHCPKKIQGTTLENSKPWIVKGRKVTRLAKKYWKLDQS